MSDHDESDSGDPVTSAFSQAHSLQDQYVWSTCDFRFRIVDVEICRRVQSFRSSRGQVAPRNSEPLGSTRNPDRLTRIQNQTRNLFKQAWKRHQGLKVMTSEVIYSSYTVPILRSQNKVAQKCLGKAFQAPGRESRVLRCSLLSYQCNQTLTKVALKYVDISASNSEGELSRRKKRFHPPNLLQRRIHRRWKIFGAHVTVNPWRFEM